MNFPTKLPGALLLTAKELELVKKGQPVAAIKAIRKRLKVSLKEAVDAVRATEKRLELTNR